MNLLPSIIRIICGLVLIVVAASRYFSVRRQLADTEGAEVQIFGYAAAAAPWQFALAFGIAIVIGLALVALGGFALMKKMQEG